jgi:hypothetical protein
MVTSMCMAVLVGTVIHALPTDRITLSWTHTVEKTRWEEDYRVVGRALMIEEARVEGSGAGMDPPGDAIWSSGWWRYRPSIGLLEEVTLANSEFARGYTICWANTCRLLHELAPRGEFVKVVSKPCRGMLKTDRALRDGLAE